MTGFSGDPVLPGFRPDPSVCRVGADYYLVTSSFEWFPGLPVFHSRDLVNWRRIGSALDRPSQLDLDGCEPSRGLFAPTIRHHDGVFHLVCTLMDGPGHFVVTATDPAGPWSEPHWLDGEGFDPSLFFDDGPDDGDGHGDGEGNGDGRAWFTAARVVDEAAGRTEIWMREYLPQERRLTGPEHVLWSGSHLGARWSEAPHLYRIDGTYLLLTAEGGTDVDHSVVAARADRVTGPYEGAPGNPLLPPAKGPVTCTGHADLVQTPNGEWRAVLLGVRPGSALGRETFLSRTTWDDGWPVFSPSSTPTFAAPSTTTSPPSPPTGAPCAPHPRGSGPPATGSASSSAPTASANAPPRPCWPAPRNSPTATSPPNCTSPPPRRTNRRASP